MVFERRTRPGWQVTAHTSPMAPQRDSRFALPSISPPLSRLRGEPTIKSRLRNSGLALPKSWIRHLLSRRSMRPRNRLTSRVCPFQIRHYQSLLCPGQRTRAYPCPGMVTLRRRADGKFTTRCEKFGI